MTTWRSPLLADWEARGRIRSLAGHEVFTLDLPSTASEQADPLLVLHGFPTCSFDLAPVLDRLNEHRRIVMCDLLGFGLSAKPDLHYTMGLQADVVQAFVAELGLERVALLSHDMGDTVGGELLARSLEGGWAVDIAQRVVTNGSIYIEMAHLTDGQQLLLSLPDAALPEGIGANEEGFAAALAATGSPNTTMDADHLAAEAELAAYRNGLGLLPRTIRYIEERRANERRFTGAIETHPSPLAIVWGTDDPIAVAPMAETLLRARPDATLTWLEGIGHYPMLEAPDAYADAILAALAP